MECVQGAVRPAIYAERVWDGDTDERTGGGDGGHCGRVGDALICIRSDNTGHDQK